MNPQFDDLSRKAAIGTLTAAERERLEEHLREQPGKRADLEWDQAFAEKLEKKIAAMPELPGWERAKRALHTEQAALKAGRAAHGVEDTVAQRRGILDRLSEWLAASLGLAINVQAAAVVLVLAQAGVIGLLALPHTETDDSPIRAGTQDPTPRGPLLRVSFRPDLREVDLRRTLAELSAEIVGGPGQIGVYLVRIKDGDLKAAAQQLRASGTTELVEIVQVRK